jgi:hypothetical protein
MLPLVPNVMQIVGRVSDGKNERCRRQVLFIRRGALNDGRLLHQIGCTLVLRLAIVFLFPQTSFVSLMTSYLCLMK